ncbi:MAG TPA: PQQ-binding-like beta-propeller repeat protein [Pirellulales bacterium]
MKTTATPQADSYSSPVSRTAGETNRKLRLWPAVIIVGVFWAFYFSIDHVEMSMFVRFILRWSVEGLVLLSFVVWWLAFSRARWFDRIVPVLVMFGGALAAGALADQKTFGSMGILGVLMAGLPFVLTVWLIWLAAGNRLLMLSPVVQRIGLCALVLITWGCFDLLRWDGIDGGQHSAFALRWSPTSEDRFLAEHAANSVLQAGGISAGGLHVQATDWPEFRGAGRNGQVHGVKLATDWEHQPPKQLWRQRVGPGWSSVIVVDGKLFTQEQRGEKETTVCYDAASGKEEWAYTDDTRFFEPLAGAGPRGTPTFAEGRIYALGATGKLNCLDAATGKRIWSRDIVSDVLADGAKKTTPAPQWGYSNSPLVAEGLVFVFAGGEGNKSLLAYRADSGEPAWSYNAGSDGYSSPQVVSIAGHKQLLMHSNAGLMALEPSSGKLLWQYPAASKMFLPITQPQLVGTDQLLVQSENGVQLIKLSLDGDTWRPTQAWDSNALKLTLNDYVVYDGCIYGFDDNVFCCVDVETGKRKWKGGRYGSGQVLLLPDQPLLVVTTETGEVVLISPNSKKLEELARFQAIEGKTWNHPVIAEGKLFVRNADEMACYELTMLAPPAVAAACWEPIIR